ncbi:MAG TPA: PepSY domain-containing protein [Halomonas sp.]|nr:PepSY domain-containing protein [Halomonas sp.]
MKTPLLVTTALAAALAAAMTFADDDCRDPVADWQPREVLRQQLEDKGWEVRRIKIDDGCYEVKGLDQDGNKVEGEFSPASLRLRKLEIEYDYDDEDYDRFDDDGDDSRESTRRRTESRSAPNSGVVSGRPSVRIE